MPWLAKRAAGEHLGRGRDDDRVPRVGRPEGRERSRERFVRAAELRLDRQLSLVVGALAEVEPAQGAAAPPEEDRRPSLAAVVVPDRVVEIGGNRVADAEVRHRRAHRSRARGERRARRMDAEAREPRLAIALLPGDDVGEGADAVELGEVEEVDEHRAAREQALDGGWRVAYPPRVGRKWRRGDVEALGAHLRAPNAALGADDLGQPALERGGELLARLGRAGALDERTEEAVDDQPARLRLPKAARAQV